MARYSHTYDAGHDPAMPVVEVVVQNILTGARSAPLLNIVDSGADGCLVPVSILQALSLRPIRRATMRAFLESGCPWNYSWWHWKSAPSQ